MANGFQLSGKRCLKSEVFDNLFDRVEFMVSLLKDCVARSVFGVGLSLEIPEYQKFDLVSEGFTCYGILRDKYSSE